MGKLYFILKRCSEVLSVTGMRVLGMKVWFNRANEGRPYQPWINFLGISLLSVCSTGLSFLGDFCYCYSPFTIQDIMVTRKTVSVANRKNNLIFKKLIVIICTSSDITCSMEISFPPDPGRRKTSLEERRCNCKHHTACTAQSLAAANPD